MSRIMFLFAMLMSQVSFSQIAGTWSEPNINATLILNQDASFSYQGPDGSFQGQYAVQQNYLVMQDLNGNMYQFMIQGTSNDQLVLASQAMVLNFQRTVGTKHSYPWNAATFDKVLGSKEGQLLKEKHVQLYIELMQLLISGKLNNQEIAQIRASCIKDFNGNPTMIIQDVQQVEASMELIYAQRSAESIAQIQEQIWGALYVNSQQNADFASSPMFQILGQYVQILSFDSATQLSLSNQDVQGYINYLQFQNMLMGQAYDLSAEERSTLQLQLVQNFSTLPAEQKQVLAYAGFLWRVVENEWLALSSAEQQQLMANVQSQMNIQNNGNYNTNWNNTNNDYTVDIDALEAKYRREAKAKGMTLDQYLDYKKRDMAVNNQIFNTIQNSMTENHATMLNLINNLGSTDDYYYVDYNNY